MNNWMSTAKQLPKDGVLVETKVDGIQSKRALKKHRNLWFDPKSSVYIYYVPTHWRSI